MTLLIDEIYKFYSNPQNLADFEEWKERKNEDSQIESNGETCQTKSAAQ
jgi:hypothetical protein|nr:MAG TPA: hypothetical protein [Caudoviricetes sp.]